jgi:hypothetical protein
MVGPGSPGTLAGDAIHIGADDATPQRSQRAAPRQGRLPEGAQTHSCSVSVLMEETAEQVASMHSALLLLANDRQPAGLIWRL